MHIIDIGHTAVMLPAAGAIGARLVFARAWKLVLCWGLIVFVGLGLVALSKMAFLGWGFALPAIGFKALSGHAWRATAVIPILLFVFLQGVSDKWRDRGFALGIAFSIALGALLVIFHFHTASEVIASSVLGISASILFVRVSKRQPIPSVNGWAAAVSLLTFLIICSLKPSQINYRLVDVALYFSGRDQPYSWKRQVNLCAVHPPEKLHRISGEDRRVPD
jgi:hypothetical protein